MTKNTEEVRNIWSKNQFNPNAREMKAIIKELVNCPEVNLPYFAPERIIEEDNNN